MDSDYEDSDVDLDDETHKKLVNNVLNLSYKQHVKKVTRTEPSLKISEFDLVKTGKNVHISDLAGALHGKGKQLEISEKIKRSAQKARTLEKPLEKPHADRIHRTVAYKKTQIDLERWDPIVASLRTSAHTTFPLHADAKINHKQDPKSDWGYKTDLQKELDALAPQEEEEEVFVMDDVDEEEFPMSMEEMIAKRNEAAKLRAHENYKIVKARRQNKIKSKKYHRIQKRAKVMQHMKEFELLQKTNPEAALEKLEEIERARAEERMSLRHKSTGQWARSKLIRAKYDRESRQVLAQQLAISRDLTQKLKKGDDSDSEPEVDETGNSVPTTNGDNPWINKNVKVSKEVADFVTGYRKYWEEQHGINEESGEKSTEPIKTTSATDDCEEDDANIQEYLEKVKELDGKCKTSAQTHKNGVKRPLQTNAVKTKKQVMAAGTSDWEVTDVKETNLEEEFNKLDNKMRQKLQQKYQEIYKKSDPAESTIKSKMPRSGRVKLSNLDLLALPKQNVRPEIDEELNESAYNRNADDMSTDVDLVLKSKHIKNSPKPSSPSAEIDPNKFMNVKPTNLDTAIPDLIAFNDNEETDQRGVISEAFQDDDILENFGKDKQDEVDKNHPKDIDLSLPGWGCWGGKGITMPSRKKKRFIVQFPEKMVRKDCNKGNLIINEDGNVKVKAHLVSDIPFPFQNVKDYEASIRAPIGNTFVPETAFRRLTKPAVTTKLGAIIEPMNEDILIKKK